MPLLIHEFENSHYHRLVYAKGEKCGEWVAYEEVARLDEYGAVTNHHSHNLPPVFRIEEITDFQSHTFEVNADSPAPNPPEEPKA